MMQEIDGQIDGLVEILIGDENPSPPGRPSRAGALR
jgi:hypothetical protein